MSDMPMIYDVRIDEERPVRQSDYDDAKRLADIFTVEHRMIRSIVTAADHARASGMKIGDWLGVMNTLERALAGMQRPN